MKLSTLFILCFLLLCIRSQAQSQLELTRTVFGKVKITTIKNFEILEYKVYGDRKYRRARIVEMQDSVIQFEGGGAIELKQIRAIKLGKGNHLTAVFQRYFVELGIIFFILSTVNNIIVPTTPVVSQQAVLISASLVTTGVLVRQLGIRRIRMSKNKTLKIVTVDYQHLNEK